MQISRVHNSVVFKRALTSDELTGYKKVLSKAKEKVGQTGKSIFIMPTTCLPQESELNTGIGHIASKKAQEFLGYMHDYLGFNVVEDLPAGQVAPKNGFYCAYNGSALALGNHQICPELLATSSYENLLTKEEVKEIVKNNLGAEKDKIVNFRNVMNPSGEQNNILKKAYERFKELNESSTLKQKYKNFVKENDDWLTFAREGEPDVGFYKFKQFLADEHLREGKKKLNDKGIKLAGDCLIGFSPDEVNAFPNAFKEGYSIGWGLPALDYDTILNKNSDSYKLLKRKVQLQAKRYDVIRFDAAWAYVSPVVSPHGEKRILVSNRKYMQNSILNNIEDWVKEVKPDFDLKNLIYEFDASPDVFSEFDYSSSIGDRIRIYSSEYMHSSSNSKWGYNKAFSKLGLSQDKYILGVGNHDSTPLRLIAEPKKVPENYNKNANDLQSLKDNAIKTLSEELSLSREKLDNPVEFSKAKFAEPMMSKNNQYFYMDVFGREEIFNLHGYNTTVHPEKNFAYKVPENYKKAYHSTLEQGYGFNPMDSLQKVFEAKGYDKTESKLYDEIKKYNSILSEETVAETIINKTKKSGNKTLKIALCICGALALLISGYFIFKKHKQKISKGVNTTV